MTSIKQERVSGRIRRILSELLVREVADPRLSGVTITNVEIDPELMYARVYVNALGDEDRAGEVLAALKHAKSFLRREVGRRVHLRNTPDLIFKWDETLARGERIYAILDELDLPPAADDDAAADAWGDDDADRAEAEWEDADLGDDDAISDDDPERMDDRA